MRELFALSWQLYRRKLDLYHSTHYVLPAWVRLQVVVTIHDIIHLLYPEFLPSNLAFLYAQRMIRRSLTRGDRIISVSQNTKHDLMQHFDVDGQKIQVIHNGVEDVFRKRLPPRSSSAGCAIWGIAQPYLLFVGNPAQAAQEPGHRGPGLRPGPRAGQFDAPLVCVGEPQRLGVQDPPAGREPGDRRPRAPARPRRPGGAAGDLPGGRACSSTPPSTRASACRWSRPWPREWP